MDRKPIKGRGAVSNSGSRYLPTVSVPVDDGWLREEEPPASPGTTLLPDRTVRLLSRNTSPDIPFDRSINPYKGCEHGCIYCFARPTHAYLDLSPGLDFETRIFFKTGVARRLQEELTARGYECRPIAMGTNTDPYQPAEKRLRITRQILTLLLDWRHPLTLVTKSTLVLRDLDLLVELARQQLVHVNVSLTTLDPVLKARLEPRAASPGARLRTMETLARAEVPVGAMLAPVIPFLNDAEMEAMVAAAVSAGARSLRYILLRLPGEVQSLFLEWLEAHYPQKARRVERAVREMRGGRLYRSQWGKRMTGTGPMAELVRRRFAVALRANGIDPDAGLPDLRTDLFRPPGYQEPLFGAETGTDRGAGAE